MKIKLFIGALLTLVIGPSANAAVVIAPSVAAPPSNIVGALTGFQTFGNTMDGMLITTVFSSGGSETIAWADTVVNSGGVTGSGWSLSQSGDTFESPWRLEATSEISSVTIDALPGRTVFDIVSSPEGTPGSASGRIFSGVTGDGSFTVTATYIGAVSLNNTFFDDLYGSLRIGFDRPYTGTLTFLSDTDSASADSQINSAVPEPSAMVIWSLSAIGLSIVRFRNRRVA